MILGSALWISEFLISPQVILPISSRITLVYTWVIFLAYFLSVKVWISKNLFWVFTLSLLVKAGTLSANIILLKFCLLISIELSVFSLVCGSFLYILHKNLYQLYVLQIHSSTMWFASLIFSYMCVFHVHILITVIQHSTLHG